MKTKISFAAILIITLLSTSCNDSPGPTNSSPVKSTTKKSSKTINFTAEITGSVKGDIAGPGVIRYLPESKNPMGTRPGYFFIADNTGIRPLGVTFTIPLNTKPGTHQLISGSPTEAGKNFEVRVDQSDDKRTVSNGIKLGIRY